MINWIVFDAMGVIFTEADDDTRLLAPFVIRRNPAVGVEFIRAAYRRASLGETTAGEFWEAVGLAGGYPQIEREYLDTCLRLNPDFLPAARELAAGHSLAILSNDVGDWASYLRGRHGLEPLIRQAVISGEVGIRKPARAIYALLLERLQAPPGRCLFVDDREDNLIPAAELGMVAIRFQPANEAEDRSRFPRIRSLAELPALAKEFLPQN